MFVYELSSCGFKSRCSHLNFRFRACFKQGFPWHSGNFRVWIHSEKHTWHDKNIQNREFLCLHSIKSLELVEKTELLRRLRVYALSKIHLDRYGSFLKILLILSWNINLNPGPVHGIQNKNLLHVLSFHDSSFTGDEFYYNLKSLSKNMSRNDWDVFQKEECTLFT